MDEKIGYTDATTTVAEVKARLRAFNQARDWEQFHQPKDLAMCLATEAGELLEPFLWKKEGAELDMTRIEEELADVIICALNLATTMDVDVMAAVETKILINHRKYPVEASRGRAEKYSDL